MWGRMGILGVRVHEGQIRFGLREVVRAKWDMREQRQTAGGGSPGL